jgi:hypothetical protein
MSMGRAVHGASCPWGKYPWGERSMGRAVCGCELSMGQTVRRANVPWGKMSMGRDVVGRDVVGRVVLERVFVGRVVMGRVVRKPGFSTVVRQMGGKSANSPFFLLCSFFFAPLRSF